MPKKLLVVGGGLLGVTAALELYKRGVEVELVEQATEEEFFRGENARASSSANIETSRSLRSSLPSYHFPAGVSFSASYYTDLQEDLTFNPDAKVFYLSNPSILVQTDITQAEMVDKEEERLRSAGVKYKRMSGRELKLKYPEICQKIPDNAVVLIEAGYDREQNPQGSSGIFTPSEYLKLIHQYIKINTNIKVTYGREVKPSEYTDYDNVVLATGTWIGKQISDVQLAGKLPKPKLVYGGYYNHVVPDGKGLIPYLKIKGSEELPEIVMPASVNGGIKILSDDKQTLAEPGKLPTFSSEALEDIESKAVAMLGESDSKSGATTCSYTMGPGNMACVGLVDGTNIIVLGYDSAAGVCYAPVWAIMVVSQVLGKEVEHDKDVENITQIRNSEGRGVFETFNPARQLDVLSTLDYSVSQAMQQPSVARQ